MTDPRLAALRLRLLPLHQKAKHAFEQQVPIKAVEVYEVTCLLLELLEPETPRKSAPVR